MESEKRFRVIAIICYIAAAAIAIFAWSLMFKDKTEIGAGVLCIAAGIAYIGMRFWSKDINAADVIDDTPTANITEVNIIERANNIKTPPVPTEKKDLRSKYHEEVFAIAGVTFRNNDRTSRQRILEKMIEEEGICCAVDAELEEYLYEGEPAIRVNTEYGCVGNIRRSDVKKVQAIRDEHASVVRTLLTPSEFYDEEEDKTVYRADVALMWLKSE